MASSLSDPVYICPMADTQQLDSDGFVIDRVNDPVRPAPGGVEPSQFTFERLSNTLGIFSEIAIDEFDNGPDDTRGNLL